MITTYERAWIAGCRETALPMLEAKFGALPDALKQRVETMPPDELRQVLLEYHKTETLKDLRLVG
jgi:hypothetical protein